MRALNGIAKGAQVKKSIHNGWPARRRMKRENDAWAREEGFESLADYERHQAAADLRAALEFSGDNDMLFSAAEVALAFKVPVKLLRLAVQSGKLRAVKYEGGRKLWFRTKKRVRRGDFLKAWMPRAELPAPPRCSRSFH